MQILFDARTISPHYPGVGRYSLGLLSALAQHSEARVTALVEQGSAAPLGLPQQAAARVRSVADQWLTPMQLARRLPAGPWVYHSPFYLYPYLLTLPAVVTLYDVTPLLQPAGFSAIARALYALAHHLAARRARSLITLTAAARDACVKVLGLPASKFAVIPPGHMNNAAAPPIEPSADRCLLYVGINKPHKNLVALVQAYAALGPGYPPLILAGPLDPRFEEAQRAAEQARLGDRVRFVGRVPEVQLARLYRQAVCLILPSLAEGFGFPVLEAMACGTPVLCSDIPVLREVASDAALYFDPRKAESIQAALYEALRQPELLANLRERGLARARTFSWERAARETLAVYEQALSD